jgi:hypothetical protein
VRSRAVARSRCRPSRRCRPLPINVYRRECKCDKGTRRCSLTPRVRKTRRFRHHVGPFLGPHNDGLGAERAVPNVKAEWPRRVVTGNPGKIAPSQNAKNPPGTQPSGGCGQRYLWSPGERAKYSDASAPPVRRSAGRRCQAVAVSSAMTSAIVRCSANVQASPTATSRAAVAASTCRQAPCAGNPITVSRTLAQAPHVLQVAPEYVAGQTAIRLPAGVNRGNEAVRSRHSPTVSAHLSGRRLNRCRIAQSRTHLQPACARLARMLTIVSRIG